MIEPADPDAEDIKNEVGIIPPPAAPAAAVEDVFAVDQRHPWE